MRERNVLMWNMFAQICSKWWNIFCERLKKYFAWKNYLGQLTGYDCLGAIIWWVTIWEVIIWWQLSRHQFSEGQFSWGDCLGNNYWGAIIWGGNCPGGGNYLGGNYPRCNCPRTIFGNNFLKNFTLFIRLNSWVLFQCDTCNWHSLIYFQGKRNFY